MDQINEMDRKDLLEGDDARINAGREAAKHLTKERTGLWYWRDEID